MNDNFSRLFLSHNIFLLTLSYLGVTFVNLLKFFTFRLIFRCILFDVNNINKLHLNTYIDIECYMINRKKPDKNK